LIGPLAQPAPAPNAQEEKKTMLPHIGPVVLEQSVEGIEKGFLTEGPTSLEKIKAAFEADAALNEEYREAGVRWSSHSVETLAQEPFTGRIENKWHVCNCAICRHNSKIAMPYALPARVMDEIKAAGPHALLEREEVDGVTYYRIMITSGYVTGAFEGAFAQVAYSDGLYDSMHSYRFVEV
jgi:hypothetical protein